MKIIDDDDKFPEGLRVLVVDDNPVCLKVVEGFLLKCHYKVTKTTEATMALKLLRDNKNNFDIVITDVQMSEMDGFRLLEIIGLEMDIPVIMISASDDQSTVRKGIEHGACDYLVKPVRLGEIQNIWQHVIRKSKCRLNDVNAGNGGTIDQNTKSRKRQNNSLQGIENETNVSSDEQFSAQKKQRVNWTLELHTKFVAAFYKLGPDNAVPSKILEEMNVSDLTREKIASHLQKYRNGLKKNGKMQDSNIGVASSGMDGNLPNATNASFDNKGQSGVNCFKGLRVDVHRSPQTIQYGHHGWNPNASSHSFVTPKSHMNQQYTLPQHCQRVQVHELRDIPSNSMTMENLHRQIYLNNSQSFSPRSRLCNVYTENSSQMSDYSASREPRSSGFQLLGCRSNSVVQNDSGIKAVQNPLPGTNEGRDLLTNMQTIEGEHFVRIDQIPSVELPLELLETDSLYQLSSCSSTDDDLTAAIKQFQQ